MVTQILINFVMLYFFVKYKKISCLFVQNYFKLFLFLFVFLVLYLPPDELCLITGIVTVAEFWTLSTSGKHNKALINSTKKSFTGDGRLVAIDRGAGAIG